MTPLSDIAAALSLDGAEDALVSVRDQARLDPAPGCPLKWSGAEIEPGAWRADGHVDDWTGLPASCPVQPLGTTSRDGKDSYHFLNPLGEVHTLDAKSMGKGPIAGLFKGRTAWLWWAWPRWNKTGKEVVGWEAEQARDALIDACANVGIYDPDRVRGRGAWRNSDGSLTYHAGDRVLVNGVWRRPGRFGDWIYPGRPPMGTPWPRPVEGGTGGPFDYFLKLVETWNWRRKAIDAHLLTGWLAQSMLNGALDWRSMLFVTAEKGSGKSTLQKVLIHASGHGALHSVNTTAAYLYQKVGHDAVPVIVDELEAQADGVTSKVVAIVEIIRTAASGGRIGRGSSEGAARDYECRSPFICTSINVPPMRGQDQSRFAILTLDPFKQAKADGGDLDWAAVETNGRQLLRRMLDGWPRWAATLTAFKTALIEQGNHDARGADQFGALLAAAHIAHRDEVPTPDELAYWAHELHAGELTETKHKTDDWRDCLRYLTDVIPDGMRNKDSIRPNLASRLAEFREGRGLEDLAKLANSIGCAISFPKGATQTWDQARLFIPYAHPETFKVFAGTTWPGVPGAGGVWHTTLQRAPVEIAWVDTCGAGLDKKRHGIMVQLAKAFPKGEDGADQLVEGLVIEGG